MKPWLWMGVALIACDAPRTPIGDDAGALGPVQAFRRDVFETPAATQIDVLFVIDNSDSMCRAQARLTRGLDVVGELASRTDVRVAVTSTDLVDPTHRGAFLTAPAAPVPTPGCLDDDGAPFVPQTEGCAGRALSPVVRFPVGASAEQIAEAQTDLACMTTLGTAGDDFEGGLEAMRLALSCDGPNADLFAACCVDGVFDPACTAEVEFLRPKALLVVFFLSDEDDCSAPTANPAASARVICRFGTADLDDDGVPDGYLDGDLCNEGRPEDCYFNECGNLDADTCHEQRCEIPRDNDDHCVWQRERLTPVEDYFRFLTRIKARPAEQLLISATVGERALTAQGDVIVYDAGPYLRPECDPDDAAYDPSLAFGDGCCPDGRCRGPVQPTCSSQYVDATAGRRYLELVDHFEGNGIGCPVGAQDPAECASICQETTSLIETFDHQIADFVRTYCVTPRLDDRLGVISECADPRCAPAQPPTALFEGADYQLSEEVGCPGNLKLSLTRRPQPSSALSLTHAIEAPTGGRAPGVCALPAACAQPIIDDPNWTASTRVCVIEGGCGDEDCVSWESGPAQCAPRCTRDADCGAGRCASPLGIPAQQPTLCESAPCHCLPR